MATTSRVIAAVAKRIQMEPRQLYDALWLAALLLSITSSYTLVKVARDVLFLTVFPASALPVVYLIVGGITLAVSWGFGRVTQRWAPFQTLVGGAIIAAVVLALFAIAFESKQPWVPIAFYAWVNIYGLLLVSQFWNFTNSISDPREARNMFGIVGGGGILGGLIGGVVATALASRVPIAWLAAAGACVLALMVIVVLFAVQRGRVRRDEEPQPPRPRGPVPLARIPYVRWLALFALCSVVVTGLLDYQLKTVVQELYPSGAAMTSFFGRYFIAMNVAALALQFIGTRWFLERLGAPLTAGLLPAGLAVGAAVTLAVPVFWAVIVTRLWDQVARFSVHRSATEVLYFPLDPDVRRRAKAFIEAGIERFGDGLAGVLILALGWFFGIAVDRLAVVALALVLVWLLAWWFVRVGYVRQLARQVRLVDLDRQADRVSLRERGVLQELVRALDSPYERVVLQALEMLEEHAAPLIVRRLPKLLEHPSARVRAQAVQLAGAEPADEIRTRIEALVRDPDPMVRLQALRARGTFERKSPFEALKEYLESPDPGLRVTALAALVEQAGEDDLPRVRERIEALLAGDDPADRAIAAETLGARPAPSELHALLVPLFDDADPAVRRAAIRSAGRAQVREHIPELLHALAQPETEVAAREALVRFGDRVVGTLGDWLADPAVPIGVRRIIPRVLGGIPTPDAVSALLRVRDPDDVVLDFRVLKAANHLRILNGALTFPADRVGEGLDRDVRQLLLVDLHVESHREEEGVPERFQLLVLRERREQAFDRIFRRLALIYPPRSVFAAYHGLMSTTPRFRGNAVEYVENILSAEHRALVMPLMPDAAPKDRRELARMRYGFEPMTAQESIGQLLETSDPWLRTCALYVVGRRRERALLERVERNLEVADARVRETAGWARKLLLEGAS